MTIRVRIGEHLYKIRGVRGRDGMIVADSRGLEQSRELLKLTVEAFEERIKPRPFSPFQPFRIPYKASA